MTGCSKCKPKSPETSGLLEADGRERGRAEPLSTKAKAHDGDASLDDCGTKLPGVVEDGMSRRSGNESLEPLVDSLGWIIQHSRDGAYNLLSREIAASRRVGRMGSIK